MTAGVAEVRFLDEEGIGRVIRCPARNAAYWREYGDGLERRRQAIRDAVVHHRALDEAAARAQTARNLARTLQETP